MTKSRQVDDYNAPLVDREGRSGTALRIILLAIVLIAAAAAFVFFKDSLGNELVLGCLGVLAMVGIFFLVSSVIGFIEVMPQRQSDGLARAFLNSHPDGTLITDDKGRIVKITRKVKYWGRLEPLGRFIAEHLTGIAGVARIWTEFEYSMNPDGTYVIEVRASHMPAVGVWVDSRPSNYRPQTKEDIIEFMFEGDNNLSRTGLEWQTSGSVP